jgi:hypothetical protein
MELDGNGALHACSDALVLSYSALLRPDPERVRSWQCCNLSTSLTPIIYTLTAYTS